MRLPADLSRPVRTTALRIRAQRALDAGVLLALAGLGVAAFALALMKTDALDEGAALGWLAGAAALPVLGALFGLLRPVHPLLPAKLLDRAHGLDDRVTNALSFAGLADRSAFMDAAIDDACLHAKSLRPARAMPLRVPGGATPALGLAIGVALLGLLEVPRVIEEPIPTGGITPVLLHHDDLAAFDSELRDVLDDPRASDEARAAAREFNRLIEDLADERLDRAETLRRIAELEQRLSQTRPASAALLRDSLSQLGRDLSRASLADELSAALRDGDAELAEAEMRSLAERLRRDPPSRAELERLRRALARAAANQPEDRSEELRAREEQMNRLLRRQREQAETPPEQQRLLQRRERELERLRREHREAMEQRRELERLQRELAEAAEALGQRQQEQASESLDRGAEDLNRMARQQRSQEEMEQLQRQLSALRELIRRQRDGQGQPQRGPGGRGQRMDRFVLRAQGEGQGGTRLGIAGQNGQQGQGQGQQGQGQGQQGQGQGQQGQSQGQQGQGQGQQGQEGQGREEQMLVLGGEGGGDAILELPGGGQRPGGTQQGPGRVGPGAGTGHDPTMLDDPTRLGGDRQTVRVTGQQGEGPSRSEVILSSAERGFASRDYRDVYTDYSSHAEEVLEQDEIPPGYRFYVRRYFQLIRPRDE